MRWLQQEYPQLVDGYEQLYARKYAPSAYRKEVSALIAGFKEKYGLKKPGLTRQTTSHQVSSSSTRQSRSDPPTPRDVGLPFQP
jgi:hypothetical protein